MINHVRAILWKQLKDTLKNKTILIQFIMFPVLTIVMENAIEMPGMQEHFFTNLFAVMYLGMAPLTSMAAIISEEKEKNTLRVLQLSNVKSMEYLLGNAIYIWMICMIGSMVIGIAGGYESVELVQFLLLMAIGNLISILVGATIGAISKNQMTATSLTVPVMMVFSFLPMLSMFNETIRKVAKILYSEQLYLMMNQLEEFKVSGEFATVLACNVVVVVIAFVFAYRRGFGK
uniref:ABC transporter permease n=1 Tax=Acetatifactor sp. TaxID=1872090 RepID=UPI0040560F6E